MSYCVSICNRCGSASPRTPGSELCPVCAGDAQKDTPSAPSTATQPAAHLPEIEVPGIPGHDVCETIGLGGMGSVHRARQDSLQRDVALKISIPERTNREDRDRFLREARVLAQLDHPNIVPIYDFGRDEDGRCYYTMKMVRGRTLKAILTAIRDDEETWGLETLLDVFRKACDAVAFAHARGVIHRDLKPENIMVGEFGEVLVVDWGLAGHLKTVAEYPEPPLLHDSEKSSANGNGKNGSNGKHGTNGKNGKNGAKDSSIQTRRTAIEASADLTMDGEVVGTPQYMSPEQAGACTDLDERCDIYALGGILHTILTLRTPLRKGPTDEMLEKVRTGRIEPFAAPEFVQPSIAPWRISPALTAIVRKAMALQREDRFQTVTALAADVDAHIAGYATTAEEISFAGLFWLFIKRHRTVSIAVFVLLIVSAGFVVQVMDSERRATHNAMAAGQNAKRAEKNEADARVALAHSNIALADSLYATNDPVRMRAALDAVPSDLRHDTNWRYLDARADERQSLLEFEGDGFLIGCTPHPTRPGVFTAATEAGKHRIVDFDVKTGKVLRSFNQREGWVRAIAYSPDGSLIALGRISGGGISIHHAEDGEEIRHWATGWADSLDFLPDGERLLQSHSFGCRMWNASKGELIWKSDKGLNHLLLPGGERIAAVGEKELCILAAADGHVLETWPIQPCTPISASISPDGARVIVASQVGLLTAFQLSDGKVLYESPADDNGNIVRTGFTPDGKRIVTVANFREGVQCVQVRDAATGRILRTLHGGVGGVESLSFHPLSGDLVVTCGRSATWVLPQTREPQWTMPRSTFENGYVGGLIGGFIGGDHWFVSSIISETVTIVDYARKKVIWFPERAAGAAASTSADGRVGAVQVFPSHDGINDFELFRADSDGIHPTGKFEYKWDARSLALNRDGSRVAIGSAWGNLAAYRTEDGQPLPDPEQGDLRSNYALAWHGTDSKRLIGLFTTKGRRGMDKTEDWIFAWDTDTGKCVAKIRHNSPMNCLATEAGGSRLAEAGNDKLVRIRDANSLAVLREFRAHDGPISAIAWNPVRPIIATGSADRSVRVWDAETGNMIEELHIGLRQPEALFFSPSGKRLACVIPGEPTLVWELSEKETVAKR